MFFGIAAAICLFPRYELGQNRGKRRTDRRGAFGELGGVDVTNSRFLPGACTRLAAIVLAVIAALQADAASPWATGPEFQRQLSRPADILWAENPLRQALARLAQDKRTAILLDRRVDPEQKIDVQISDVPLRAALQQIAAKQGLGVSILGSVVYIGPAAASSRLRTLAAVRADDARRLPAAAARKFQRAKAMRWDDLATPRSLLAGLAEDNGLDLAGLDLVPHDLWVAAELPPLSLTDRLTLVVVQFDLTFAVQSNGAGLRLAPLPRRVAVARSYPGGADPEATARRLAALAPARKSRSSAATSAFAA